MGARQVGRLVLVVFAVSLAVASGLEVGSEEPAWPMRGRDYYASYYSPVARLNAVAVKKLRVLWRFQADSGIGGSPAVDHGMVYIGSSRGTLYALDLATGRKRWEAHLGARPQLAYGFDSLGITGTPALSGERVYVATALTDVVCLDATTGGFFWRTRVGDPGKSETIWSAPLVWDGRVYVGIDGILDEPTVRGRVVAVDAATGAVVWTYVIPQYTGGGGAGVFGSPSVDPSTGTLFVATGNPSPRTNPPPGPDVGSDSILALDAVTGRLRWAFGPTHPHDDQDLDFLSTPNVFPLPGGLAVGAGEKDGTYYVVDARTGRLRWKTALTLPQERGAVITGSAAVAYGKIFVGTQDYPPSAKGFSVDLPGRLVALDAATGRVVWALSGPRQILGPPAVSEGVVFAADYDGTVWAVDAAKGTVLWRGTVGGFVWKGGVTLAPGMVLVGAATPANALVAFGVPRLR